MLEVLYNPPTLPFVSQAQLEKMVTKLKVEKAQVEASLREEEAKCGMLLKEVKDANEVRTFSCKSNGILVRHLEKHDAVTKPEHFFVKFMHLNFIFQRSKFIFLFVIFPVYVLSLRWKSKFMNFKLSLACRSRQRKLISEMLYEINLSERKIYISQV